MDAKTPTDAEPEALWEDLVLSILSVNGYSLEKSYSFVAALRREGLFSPPNLIHWSEEEIGKRLRRAGYDRGDFMTRLFALRLLHLGVFLETKGVEETGQIIRSGKAAEVRKLLGPVYGIGPRVLANLFILREVKE
jgi:hypothetical protein